MSKLNFGCGNRIAENWINIDFHSSDSRVRRVNLLRGLPYPDNHFEAVYSSHVLEHFTREQALCLLSEVHRVLMPTGTLRIVVPDLAGTCKEYVRILALAEDEARKPQLYEWIIIELLDQMVRARPDGEMGPFIRDLEHSDNEEMSKYVRSRIQSSSRSVPATTSLWTRLRRLTPQKVSTRLTYEYVNGLKALVPKDLRSELFVQTSIGERHRWMYDSYGLRRLCEKAGFRSCRTLAYNESGISGFHEDHLDSNADGANYKNNSIYLEASP